MECMIQCLSILHRLVNWSINIFVEYIDQIIDQFQKVYLNYIPKISNNKAKDIITNIIRIIEVISRNDEFENVIRFSEFLNLINNNNHSREIF